MCTQLLSNLVKPFKLQAEAKNLFLLSNGCFKLQSKTLTVLAQLTMMHTKERATDSEGQNETEMVWPLEFFSTNPGSFDCSLGVGSTLRAISVNV